MKVGRIGSIVSKMLFSLGLIVAPLVFFGVATASYGADVYPNIIGVLFVVFLILAFISIFKPKYLVAVLICLFAIVVCSILDAQEIKQRNMGLCDGDQTDPQCSRTVGADRDGGQ